MAIRVDERYVVHAPVGAVWDFLVDPRRVVACVPGGELLSVIDERTYDGTIRVKVGPLTLAYGGRVRLAEVDTEARSVKIVGEARERAGSDSARLTLESRLVPLSDDATEVVAHARVDVAGRVVELGRGVLEPLGHLVFRQFAASVRATIEAGQAAVAAGIPAAPPGRVRQEPLSALPLVLRAVKAWMAGWLRAAAGRGRRD